MLARDDLWSLEEYSQIRHDFKPEAVKHRRLRQVEIGNHMTVFFEDRVTIKYQIQEMLLIEKTFTPEGIQDELDAYNPLIPTGTNLKATLCIEYSDPELRAVKLRELVNVEDRVFVKIGGHEPVYAIADEDISRSTQDKTSAVHFMRFELTEGMITALRHGEDLHVGVDHPAYPYLVKVGEATRDALVQDFDGEHVNV